MLVLSRKIGEEILIGGDVRLVVHSIHGRRVRLGVLAPEEVPVYRAELLANREEGMMRKVVSKAR